MTAVAPETALSLPGSSQLVPPRRIRIEIRGAVQGVGFRPHVHGAAQRLGVSGWVRNTMAGVEIEAEGDPNATERFARLVTDGAPALARISGVRTTPLPVVGGTGFRILESEGGAEANASVQPDIATCPDCLRELFDEGNRRHRYPFINCTHCGPRFTIIDRLPYDRANTSMAMFTMCPDCLAEYENPSDRRFHAQPNACARCGPHVELWDAEGHLLSTADEAIGCAVTAIRGGSIVACKGLGGFQLLVDATNRAAVRRLRARKHRPDKPLAVMVRGLGGAQEICEVGPGERALLLSPVAPIVLMPWRGDSVGVAIAEIAPRNPNLGVMLPTTPLHHLLLHDLGSPVVATSGNRTDEPICIDEHQALERLRGIADLFLVHNRPIRRHADDSVARVICGEPQVLRRARGYAPHPIRLDDPRPAAVAFGAHQKSACAIGRGREVILSQHIGDLEAAETVLALESASEDLARLHHHTPAVAVCDLHPDYQSTHLAERSGLPLRRVQHHMAHVLACAVENGIAGPALGVAWDGTGLGSDGTIWGGEFFRVEGIEAERVAHLRPFTLPGGDLAAREPRRAALGVLLEIFGEDLGHSLDLAPLRAFTPEELQRVIQSARREINTPRTSSMGRLFDAVASLCDIRQRVSFEGQAAMELEIAAAREVRGAPYEHGVRITNDRVVVIDWEPTIWGAIGDALLGLPPSWVAARFHRTLVQIMVTTAKRVGLRDVLLTGGCFQSRLLTEQAVTHLRDAGFTPHWHRRVPPNDGGIALGQIAALAPLGGEG